jgi:hypothetical protein
MIRDVAGADVEERDVGAVAVDEEDLAEAVVGEALSDVGDVLDEGVAFDGNGAGEVGWCSLKA